MIEMKEYEEDDEEIIDVSDNEKFTKSQGKSIAERSLVSVFYEKGLKIFPKPPKSTSNDHSDNESLKSDNNKETEIQLKTKQVTEMSVRWSQIEKDDNVNEEELLINQNISKISSNSGHNKTSDESNIKDQSNSKPTTENINNEEKEEANKIKEAVSNEDTEMITEESKELPVINEQIWDDDSNNDWIISDNPLSADNEDNHEGKTEEKSQVKDKPVSLKTSQILSRFSQNKDLWNLDRKREKSNDKQNNDDKSTKDTKDQNHLINEAIDTLTEKIDQNSLVKVPDLLQNNFYEHKPSSPTKCTSNVSFNKSIRNITDRKDIEIPKEKMDNKI